MKEGTSKKQKTESGTAVIVNQANEMILRLSRAPIDVFLEIIKELSFVQIAAIVRAANQGKANNEYLKVLNRLRSNHAVTAVWLPYLKALKQMDSTVPLEPAVDIQDKDAWYYRTVMNASHAIHKRQCEEIANLRNYHPHHELYVSFDAINDKAENLSLSTLIARHRILDLLNISLIETRLDLKTNELDLSELGITRIPEVLFNIETLSSYWRRLGSLECNGNNLRELPNSIVNLVALKELNCAHNQIQKLPGTIGSLVTLESLICSHNQLKNLPDTIGNLVALWELECANNQLEYLPETIGNLKALRCLTCRDNELRKLPDTIGNLFKLHTLWCSNNLLLELPKGLQVHFNQLWLNETLRSQRRPVAPVILPQFTAVNLHLQQGVNHDLRPLITIEMDQAPRDKGGHKKRKNRD